MPRWSNIHVHPAGQVASGLPANANDIAQGSTYLTKLGKTCGTWRTMSVANQQYLVQSILKLTGSDMQTALQQINAFCPAAIPATGTPAQCTMPINSLNGTPGYYDPYFQTQAAHDAWAVANPTCPPPPPFMATANGQPVSDFYTPGQSLTSPGCLVQIGLPPTQANAIAWSAANPMCAPVVLTTDAYGNPIIQSVLAPPQLPAQPMVFGVPLNTVLIVGGVVAAIAAVGGVIFFTSQSE